MAKAYDCAVVGAGMVGAAIAYGLAGRGRRVVLLDGADTDFRAAKANFGLVWVQGKGHGHPHYQRLSHQAAALWPSFADELQRESGIAIDYEARGGLHFCLGERQLAERAERMAAWQAQAPEQGATIEMLDRGTLQRRFPGLRPGPDVAGASLGLRDGHVNPLRLLAALHAGFGRRGGVLLGGQPVERIAPQAGGGYRLSAGPHRLEAGAVVIAAGLGSPALAGMVGLQAPLRPQRGQVLVTERLAPLLPLPASGVRQTAEGSVLVGLTQEEVGYDLGTTTRAACAMSRNAVRVLPALAGARLVRQWACLRIMTPDGCPVYAGGGAGTAHLALCHSGVTLAAFHAGPYAGAVAGGALPDSLRPFHYERFHVQKAA